MSQRGPTDYSRLVAEAIAQAHKPSAEAILNRTARAHQAGCAGRARAHAGQSPTSLVDGFSSLLAGEPAAASAWNSLSNTIAAEGGDLYQASSNFLNSWNELSSSNWGMPSEAIANAASSLVMANGTLGGIATTLEGLVSSASSVSPPQIAQAITGTLIAAAGPAIAAGTVSFGVGAVIVIGAALISDAVAQCFGSPAVVATICNAQISGPMPTYNIGCVWTYGDKIPKGPGSPIAAGQSSGSPNGLWRRFPDPTNSRDAWWYQTPSQAIGQDKSLSVHWTSAPQGNSQDLWEVAMYSGRPIDAAWPQYHQLECDANAAAVVAALPDAGGTVAAEGLLTQPKSYSSDDVMFARFIMAYFAAWKANVEYALNGIPSKADDGDVLMHVVNLWNRAHTPGATRTITPRNQDNQSYLNDVITYPQPCAGTLGSEWWYVSMLLQGIAEGNVGSRIADMLGSMSGATLTIHTGPLQAAAAASLAPGRRIAGHGPAGVKAGAATLSYAPAVSVVAGLGATLLWANPLFAIAGIALAGWLSRQQQS